MPSLCAQSEREKINEIKKTLNFIYAESSSRVSAQEATENAKTLLTEYIYEWLRDVAEGDFSGYVAKASSHVEEIATQRGKLMRSFVYVRKTDILPYYKEESIVMVAKDDKVSIDTVVIGTKSDRAEHVLSKTTETTRQIVPSFVLTSAERDMLNVKNLDGINRYISQGSKNGEITGYGKYDNTTRLMSKSYLYLINKDGDVIAVLRKDGSTITNLHSGASVTVGDYGKCGVIWFQINEE